jgi:putative membrane protein
MTREETSFSTKLAQERTDWAHERTHMAATRTYFSLLRTGIAIAGVGALVTSILADGWPEWVIGLLSSIFIFIGFAIVIAGLQRYLIIAKKLLSATDELNVMSPRLLISLTVILQVATVTVFILFLIGKN